MAAIQWIQLLIALSFLVVIHELGHFTFARLFKVRVEKFYMFFNPRFSLFRMKKVDGKWRFAFFAPNVEPAVTEQIDPLTNQPKKDDKGNVLYRPMTDEEINALPEGDWRRDPDNTEWGIGWVPFGGYCSIAGMVDETKAATDLPSEPQPWEFRSKKAWQRLLIILGGILVNFVAALLMFGAILYHWGEDSLPLKKINHGLYYSQIFVNEGFQQRDIILTIDGKEPRVLNDVLISLVFEGKREVVVLRGSDTIRLQMSEDFGKRFLAAANGADRKEREKAHKDKTYKKRSFVSIDYYIPFVVDSVLENNSAFYSGIQRGDSIVSVNGELTPCVRQVINAISIYEGDSVTLGFYRDTLYLEKRVFCNDQGYVGMTYLHYTAFYNLEHKDFGFWESIPAGIQLGWEQLLIYVKQFRIVFSKEGAEALGGFGAMKNMFPQAWNWQAFWYMTAFLSLILAFMNFLPIPALDGGYVLLLLLEMITGRQIPDKWLEKINNVGFWLLIALLIYANGNDIFKAFF